MTGVPDLVLTVAAVPVVACCTYLLALTLCSRRRPPLPAATGHPFFDVVVPAHDEEPGIAATVRSLLAVHWPADRMRVTVVADNCSDGTARVAEAAGARVLVRTDVSRRGKGYALEYAFARLGDADAAVVVDADSVVSPNLLAAFAARLARGERAIQARYGVRNPDVSWRTRLMAIALGMFHVVRSRGREALGLSCGLRGNGMCFAATLLRDVPPRAYSIVEDVEYGLVLAEKGVRVAYADEAHVDGEMVSTAAAARSQRRRWEEGRRALARSRGPSLVWSALVRRDPLLFDIAADLLVPPLSALALCASAGTLLSHALAARLAQALWGASLFALAAYGARGWALSGTGWQGLASLVCAPAYVVWKITVTLHRSPSPDAWIRTSREGKPS